eukprot:gnl/TRDRNA2_/TRDRNA2_176257_c1_seq3.p1 gnl/TRDRNA2_/TRDRNA2_176257_c1~~gnl/TRDRNA2_/TRDRNA2_176257_c1_seq3.p1  ORF type:complete len:384 (-),score=-39.64 gnl/TRDRNA2_/TRDRNA2_176257_c1_seq3:382-1533(-)
MTKNFEKPFDSLEKAHELKRVINSVKLEKLFAKPFLAALEHSECITAMSVNKEFSNTLLTGSADGVVRLWDIPRRRILSRFLGHTKSVRGVSVSYNGTSCVSCSDDCTIRLWKIGPTSLELGPMPVNQKPFLEFIGREPYHDIDCHPTEPLFVTVGSKINLWMLPRQQPLQTFSSTSHSILSVKFNPIEKGLFVSSNSGREIGLYDLRLSGPIDVLTEKARSNSVAWNPSRAFFFSSASEDAHLYTYDMRNTKSAVCIHKDFVSSVLSLDYSPSGEEFLAGSYDGSIRIFTHLNSHSHQTYHTKRMLRVTTVKFSPEGEYVFSGSDDMNVRIWRARTQQRHHILNSLKKFNQTHLASMVNFREYVNELRFLSKTSIPKRKKPC